MTTTTLVDNQASIHLKITTPLGENVVIMQHLSGQEELSRPFEYIAQVVSKNSNISFEALLGKSVTISIDCHEGIRYINGVVGQFKQLITAKQDDDNATYYEAKIYPSFWLLNFVQDCRIFQDKTCMDIVKQILRENNILYFQDLTSKQGNTNREYCVQYNETSFNFISRLLEEEGIFYYFKQEDQRHTLIFCDDSSTLEACENNDQVKFEGSRPSQSFLGSLLSCHIKEQVITKSLTLKDYNFTIADTSLSATEEFSINSSDLSQMDNEQNNEASFYQDNTQDLNDSFKDEEQNNFESNQEKKISSNDTYIYPAILDHEDQPAQLALEELIKIRRQEKEVTQKIIEGSSTIPFFAPGYRFTLQDHPREDANGDYFLLKVDHTVTNSAKSLTQGQLYQNKFQAIPVSRSFRPAFISQKPRIHSTQTATVTGPENEEIWTDKYGRIKVLFHWDRLSSNDQESSCWVRVAEAWAGNGWGTLFTPRIGMEVVVTFLEGDPDRPLVIGSVYNSTNMPPYLPNNPTKSTIKTRSTKGSEGANELRFEDLKESEQIYIHAQKDRDFQVCETATDWIQKGSYWLWIDKGSRETMIGGAVGLPKITPIGQELPAGKGDDNLLLLSGSKNIKVQGVGGHYNLAIAEGDHMIHMTKGIKYTFGVEMNQFLEIENGNVDTVIQKGDISEVILEGNRHEYLNAGSRTSGILKGSYSQEVDFGHMLFGINAGNMMVTINEGTSGTYILEGKISETVVEGNRDLYLIAGDSNTHIVKGNHSIQVDTGSQQTKIGTGSQNIEIAIGDRSIRLGAGNEQHIINGSSEQTIANNSTLTINGNLTIIVGGSVKIESGSGIDLTTAGNITMTAANITMTAAESISQKAGVNISQTAGVSMNLESELQMNLSASIIDQCAKISYNVTSLVEATIEAGANVSIQAPLLSLA